MQQHAERLIRQDADGLEMDPGLNLQCVSGTGTASDPQWFRQPLHLLRRCVPAEAGIPRNDERDDVGQAMTSRINRDEHETITFSLSGPNCAPAGAFGPGASHLYHCCSSLYSVMRDPAVFAL